MKKKVGPITLGGTYKDVVHGSTGIATCYATHLTGCNRVCLEWLDDSGNVQEVWIDETRIKGLKLDIIENGPGNDPPSRRAK